jgi:hypothetical protein
VLALVTGTFDRLVTGGVIEHNLALPVKAPRQKFGKGKTPVGLSWPLPEGLGDAALELQLYPPATSEKVERPFRIGHAFIGKEASGICGAHTRRCRRTAPARAAGHDVLWGTPHRRRARTRCKTPAARASCVPQVTAKPSQIAMITETYVPFG